MYNVHVGTAAVKIYSVLMAYPGKTDRGTILAVALSQVERDGLKTLAIRSVATTLGLAPNALYRYFANLTALEAAVAEEARRQVLEAMEAATRRKGPAEAVRALSEAYLRFSWERRNLFSLYLNTYGTKEHTPQCVENTNFFLKHVSALYGDKDAEDASHLLWALLHGSAVLLDAGLITRARAFDNLKRGLEMWISNARKTPRHKRLRRT